MTDNSNEKETMLQVYTPDRYNREIEGLVSRTKMKYLDAIQYHAEENNLEPETVAELINSNVKGRLREEAEALNYLPKTAKLPL